MRNIFYETRKSYRRLFETCLHKRLFVRLYTQNNAMTFIKFDIGEFFFPRFGTVVTVFGSKADDKRHYAHEKNKIFIKERVFIPRATKWIFFYTAIKIFALFHVIKMSKDFDAVKFYLSRGLSRITRDITDLRVTKIEGSCRSRFFTIFQALPTE